MKLLIIAACLTVTTLACKCRKLPSNEAFCNADWVSHVKVTASKLSAEEEDQPSRQLYTVTHVRTLKKPSGCDKLPTTVSTSTSSASCGLTLDVGKEYLLSGGYEDGALNTGTCGQISPDDPDSGFGVAMEWKDVSSKFLDQILAFKC